MAQENVFIRLRKSYKINGKPASLRQLEKAFNKKIAHSHISELEHGLTPSLNQLKTYHDFFGVTYDYLLGDITETYDSQRKEVLGALDYLNKSDNETDIKIRDCANNLLTTDKGYALLFYLTEFFENKITDNEISIILKKIKECDDSMDYNDIRIITDNVLKSNKKTSNP